MSQETIPATEPSSPVPGERMKSEPAAAESVDGITLAGRALAAAASARARHGLELVGAPYLASCTATAGAAANIFDGLELTIATAAPLHVLSSTTNRAGVERGDFNEVKQSAARRSFAKLAVKRLKATTIADLPGLVCQALDIPGGCYLHIPSDVLQQTLPESEAAALITAAAYPAAPGHSPRKHGTLYEEEAVDLLRRAERPLVATDMVGEYARAEDLWELLDTKGMGMPLLQKLMQVLPHFDEPPKFVFEEETMLRLRKPHVGIVGDAKGAVELVKRDNAQLVKDLVLSNYSMKMIVMPTIWDASLVAEGSPTLVLVSMGPSDNGSGRSVHDLKEDSGSSSNGKGEWSSLPTDVKMNVLERCPFKYTMKFYVAVGKDSSNVPYDRMQIPADTTPLLLHCGTLDKFMLYDPLNNIIFEIDRPKNSRVGMLCDFWQQYLVTTIDDGVALMNMRTGPETVWKILTMPSDCFIICHNDHVVRAVLGAKGYHYTTTMAILKKSGMEQKAFETEVPFTVSPLTNPILRRNKLFCFSTEGKLGLFDLESNVSTIYEEEQADNHEDTEEEEEEEDGKDDDGKDDVDDGDDGESMLNDFRSPADFLCATQKEIFGTRVEEGWKSVQVEKLEEPDMNWKYINSLGDKAIFTGTRCSIISTVPKELQNKVFLPGYYGSPPIVKAKLIESEGRFFFCPTHIGGMGNTSSPWFCVIGEGSDGKSSTPSSPLENCLWIQLNSLKQ